MIFNKNYKLLLAILILLIAGKDAKAVPGFISGRDSSANKYPVKTFDNSILASEENRESINQLFTDYLKIKNSLADNNIAAVQMHELDLLNKIEKALPEIDKNLFSDPKALSGKIDGVRSKVQKAVSLSDQRFLFSEMINGLLLFVKSYGLKNKTIYVMQTDDASGYGKGLWLSDSPTDYRNPYKGISSPKGMTVRESWVFK